MTYLEIACFNRESAAVAGSAGADRIELCTDAEVGGTTPSLSWLGEIRTQTKIPVNVMIRPRGGDFVYSDLEFQAMKDSISEFKSLADGFVFGILKDDRRVDVARTSELVELAQPLPCTFHRAFDETPDLHQALEDVVRCGMTTILTSGGGSTAMAGRDVLAQLVDQAGQRIVIMPGGGVRSSNIRELQVKTRALAYHSSALVGDSNVASVDEIVQMKSELVKVEGADDVAKPRQ